MSAHEPFSEDLLSAYLDGEATPAERAQVEAWLAADVARQQLYRDLVELRSGLKSLPTVTTGEDFRQRVLQSIGASAHAPIAESASTNHARPSVEHPVLPTSRDAGPAPTPLWQMFFATLAASVLLAVMAVNSSPDMQLGHRPEDDRVMSGMGSAPSSAVATAPLAKGMIPRDELPATTANGAPSEMKPAEEFFEATKLADESTDRRRVDGPQEAERLAANSQASETLKRGSNRDAAPPLAMMAVEPTADNVAELPLTQLANDIATNASNEQQVELALANLRPGRSRQKNENEEIAEEIVVKLETENPEQAREELSNFVALRQSRQLALRSQLSYQTQEAQNRADQFGAKASPAVAMEAKPAEVASDEPVLAERAKKVADGSDARGIGAFEATGPNVAGGARRPGNIASQKIAAADKLATAPQRSQEGEQNTPTQTWEVVAEGSPEEVTQWLVQLQAAPRTNAVNMQRREFAAKNAAAPALAATAPSTPPAAMEKSAAPSISAPLAASDKPQLAAATKENSLEEENTLAKDEEAKSLNAKRREGDDRTADNALADSAGKQTEPPPLVSNRAASLANNDAKSDAQINQKQMRTLRKNSASRSTNEPATPAAEPAATEPLVRLRFMIVPIEAKQSPK